MVFHHASASLLQALLWLMPTPAAAGAMGSWYTGLGAPQVVMQDDATGKIFHSFCYSPVDPIFPGNASFAFPIPGTDVAPKNGTGLAASGYQEGPDNYAALFWQTDEGKIVEGLFVCNATTGLYSLSNGGPWVISTSVPSSGIHPHTGLAAAVLNADEGIRVYFQYVDNTLAFLQYKGSWAFGGNISHDPQLGHMPAVGWTDIQRLSVVAPRDNANIEVADLQLNSSWILSTFPTPLEGVIRSPKEMNFTLPPSSSSNATSFSPGAPADWALPAWDGGGGGAAGLSLAFDSDARRTVYYIGNDSRLHWASEDAGGGGVWTASEPSNPDDDDDKMPPADRPNAPFAAASDYSADQVWLYYLSGGDGDGDGSMVQLHKNGSTWERAVALQRSAPAPPPPSPPPLPTRSPALSTAAQAGIGVGAAVAALALLAFAVYVYRQRRRGRAEAQARGAEAEEPRSPAPAYSSGLPPGEGEGRWVVVGNNKGGWGGGGGPPYGYASPPQPVAVFEMANQEFSHEMAQEASHHEMPAVILREGLGQGQEGVGVGEGGGEAMGVGVGEGEVREKKQV
ncbi:hypothetical protein F4780DRAFT_603491 [Xylariomycetidae sp. FL0641]|nr:hypothetical protein F4780DRAFT_603491 [Xylariomycetidae sp. FL0641]